MGKEYKPEEALKYGAVDAVVTPEQLFDASVALVKQCNEGKINYKARREEKRVSCC